ncbi:MAG TPA: hypothetical protein VHB51_00580 [Candidatus Saccharimonadales bacterium]|nr:hypothetical protein [Candidatus Saccharimonadales bacterium]
MQIVALLKRKDASSVVVAVSLGIIVANAVQAWADAPANWLSGIDSTNGGWRNGFWQPLFALVVGVIVLEIVIRVYTNLVGSQSGKK